MRALQRAGVALALALLAFGAGARGDQAAARPFEGVAYFDRADTSPRPVRMHVAQIDLRAPGVRVAVSPMAGVRETVRQTTLDFLESQGAQLAINAHFFLPFPLPDRDAWVIGLAASAGHVYSAFETPSQRFAIVANGPALNIDAANRASIVRRLAAASDGLTVQEPVTLWNAVAGSAQIVTSGRPTVPVYRDEAHPDGLLEPGGPSGFSNARSWYAALNARTAIGLSRDRRTLTLFTVDVRGGSEGMRLDEVAAALIRDYAVWDALNLDGGGSTTMAMEDPRTGRRSIVNTPSDNPLGRAVATSLAVFARRR